METDSVKTPVEARQGDRRFMTYRVLVRSLVIAVLAAVVLYGGYYFTNTSDSPPAGRPAASPPT